MQVWGIGSATARKFVNMGLRSLADLSSHQDLLNSAQRIGLAFHSEFALRIPRDDVERATRLVCVAVCRGRLSNSKCKHLWILHVFL